MPFLTPLLQEWKELTAKPTAQGSPALHKAEAGNPTAHAQELQHSSLPTHYNQQLMQGAGLKAECSGGLHVPPVPGAARVAGRSDTPAPGAPARVLRADPASPPGACPPTLPGPGKPSLPHGQHG